MTGLKIKSADNAVKNTKEILTIKKACKVADKLFDRIILKIKPDVSEKQIFEIIINLIKEQGVNFAFPPIVAFGKNSFEPHHESNATKLKKGDFILIDFGVKIDGYCSDMTRTLFLGKASNKQKHIYQTVLDAQKKAYDFINKYSFEDSDGIWAREVDKVAREYIIKKGYPFMPHSLGHGIGRQIHESPKLSFNSEHLLKQNMVFSLEPGIYIKDFGGVRIEDLVVLKKNGLKILTHSPKDIIEL